MIPDGDGWGGYGPGKAIACAGTAADGKKSYDVADLNNYLQTLSDLSTTWNNLELEVNRVMNDPDSTIEQLLEIQNSFPDMNLSPVPDNQPVFAYYDLLQSYLTEASLLAKETGDRVSHYNNRPQI